MKLHPTSYYTPHAQTRTHTHTKRVKSTTAFTPLSSYRRRMSIPLSLLMMISLVLFLIRCIHCCSIALLFSVFSGVCCRTDTVMRGWGWFWIFLKIHLLIFITSQWIDPCVAVVVQVGKHSAKFLADLSFWICWILFPSPRLLCHGLS